MAQTVWIDVEDLFQYGNTSARPSGIQRLAFHICDELRLHDGEELRVRFLRHSGCGARFTPVDWQEVEGFFLALASQTTATVATLPSLTQPTPSFVRRLVRKRLRALPEPVHRTIVDVGLTALSSARAWSSLAKAVVQSSRTPRVETPLSQDEPLSLLEPAIDGSAAGDWLLSLGAPWWHPNYPAMIARHRERLELRFGLLIHDLLPVRRPEWFDAVLVPRFSTWLDAILPLCDQVFANSRTTATDIDTYLRERNSISAAPVVPLPIGTNLGVGRPVTGLVASSPVQGDFVLIVSTIEVRKNHLLLFRIWRRLLDELPTEQVPSLVFAGRVGWLVNDLMQQIANTSNLNGKLIFANGPTDDELEALYAECLFTVVPSFREGWGLPVTESLARGKPCLTSNASALLEAAGNLARSFDPDDLRGAYSQIETLILDRAALAQWQADVRKNFRPVPWSATAETVLTCLSDNRRHEKGQGFSSLALSQSLAAD